MSVRPIVVAVAIAMVIPIMTSAHCGDIVEGNSEKSKESAELFCKSSFGSHPSDQTLVTDLPEGYVIPHPVTRVYARLHSIEIQVSAEYGDFIMRSDRRLVAEQKAMEWLVDWSQETGLSAGALSIKHREKKLVWARWRGKNFRVTFDP